jgi:hypothetical protein
MVNDEWWSAILSRWRFSAWFARLAPATIENTRIQDPLRIPKKQPWMVEADVPGSEVMPILPLVFIANSLSQLHIHGIINKIRGFSILWAPWLDFQRS